MGSIGRRGRETLTKFRLEAWVVVYASLFAGRIPVFEQSYGLTEKKDVDIERTVWRKKTKQVKPFAGTCVS